MTWVFTAFTHTGLAAKSAWTPSPRGPLPPGENREARETEKVAAALKSGPRATRGRYRTRGQAAALHPLPPATD